jgi:hypothetical protein
MRVAMAGRMPQPREDQTLARPITVREFLRRSEARVPLAPTLLTGAPLDADELRMLDLAQAQDGRVCFRGLSVGEMVLAGSTALELEKRGLVKASVRFARGVAIYPEVVEVELTAAGLRCVRPAMFC